MASSPAALPAGPILVAGARGMVGSALVRALESNGAQHVVSIDRGEADLSDPAATEALLDAHRPAWLFLAAAKVGGIHANDTWPAEFIRDNLALELSLIHAAWRHGVQRLLFLGSSCIYPKHADQPMAESALLTGPLEPTNEPYAIAKIAGIKMCESYRRQYGCDFRSVMPTNLYGPNDNFDLQTSHVLPALIAKCHAAKEEGRDELVIWGSGTPRREFLHVDDLARGCLHLMGLDEATYWDHVEPRCSHVNLGTGEDVTIADLAQLVADVVGFKGRMVQDASHPDGTPRKLLDVSLADRLGWQAEIPLRLGLEQTYAWYLEHHAPAGAPASREPA